MNLKCYIIDDEPTASGLIARYIERTQGLELVGVEYDSLKASEDIASGVVVPDITFLDIEMPGMDGLEVAGIISEFTLIVFTTGHRQFGAESYRHGAVDYLLKPIRYELFLESIDRAKKKIADNNMQDKKDHLFVKEVMVNKLVKVVLDEVLHIESSGNYSKIVLLDRKCNLVHISLNKLMASLPKDRFVRVHKSFIVNTNHIQSLDGNMLTMSDGSQIQMGASYRSNFFDALGGRIVSD